MHVFKELDEIDIRAAKGINYRRGHHPLTVMYEVSMDVVVEDCYQANRTAEHQAIEMEHRIQQWIKMIAEHRQTTPFWVQSLFEVFPAYGAPRTAPRTGKFGLRLAALRRTAPAFYRYEKV